MGQKALQTFGVQHDAHQVGQKVGQAGCFAPAFQVDADVGFGVFGRDGPDRDVAGRMGRGWERGQIPVEHAGEFDGGVTPGNEQGPEGTVGHGADFVVDGRAAFDKEGFEAVKVACGDRTGEAEAEGLGDGGIGAIEHGAGTGDFLPDCSHFGLEFAAGLHIGATSLALGGFNKAAQGEIGKKHLLIMPGKPRGIMPVKPGAENNAIVRADGRFCAPPVRSPSLLSEGFHPPCMIASIPTGKGIEGLFGTRDENMRLLELGLNVSTRLANGSIEIEGERDSVLRAGQILEDYFALIHEGMVFQNTDLTSLIKVVATDPEVTFRALANSGKQRTFGRKVLTPKSVTQRRYLEAIERNDLVFGLGPAGTGKTYLAVAMAVQALIAKKVSRIILTRPAVEAGEKLGFLPGTLQEKIDPYLRPLYDALHDMLEPEKIEKLLERHAIEIAPLAFMRGRTLSDSFIILDEAQNTTQEQMKMVLTRQGFNSKTVVTGDLTQIDLPGGRKSGLLDAVDVLRGVEGISFVQFDEKDVVRHSLVQKIVRAYEKYNESVVGRQMSLKLAEPPAQNTEPIAGAPRDAV